MAQSSLEKIRDIIQEDLGLRGLRTDPQRNLITAYPDGFARACQCLARTPQPRIAIVTGFFIPTGKPPAGETDGPLGALFLARALVPLGFRVVLATDAFCVRALQVGLTACNLQTQVPIVTLPSHAVSQKITSAAYWDAFQRRTGPLTHLIALERVGPNHTLESLRAQQGGEAVSETYLDFLQEVPEDQQDRCFTMRGRDITTSMSPAHLLFEAAPRQTPPIITLGIGDGGNEIGMGKILWEIIQRNIPGGGLVACRVPTDHLIVCGVSNWGAYGLAAGIRACLGRPVDKNLFDPTREQQLLQLMVQHGPLVDGISGEPTTTVDGLSFVTYGNVLQRLVQL